MVAVADLFNVNVFRNVLAQVLIWYVPEQELVPSGGSAEVPKGAPGALLCPWGVPGRPSEVYWGPLGSLKGSFGSLWGSLGVSETTLASV